MLTIYEIGTSYYRVLKAEAIFKIALTLDEKYHDRYGYFYVCGDGRA